MACLTTTPAAVWPCLPTPNFIYRKDVTVDDDHSSKYGTRWSDVFLTATFAVPSCLFIYTRKATSTSIVEMREIESRFEACKATVLPLNYIPISAQGGSRTHKTTALNRVHIPVLLLGHNSTFGWCFSPQLQRSGHALTRAIIFGIIFRATDCNF